MSAQTLKEYLQSELHDRITVHTMQDGRYFGTDGPIAPEALEKVWLAKIPEYKANDWDLGTDNPEGMIDTARDIYSAVYFRWAFLGPVPAVATGDPVKDGVLPKWQKDIRDSWLSLCDVPFSG
jgi:hypothetical protein